MGNDQAKAGGGVTPAGIQSMDESLQKKFSKGIQFNSTYTVITWFDLGHAALHWVASVL